MTKLIQPTYTTKQPSTGKTVSFRPFTVKEEKSLLLALQDADIETTTLAIKNVISSCTSLDPDKIPYYDVEWIYLQIRSKSIGETIDMLGGCTCDPKVKTEFEIDVTNPDISIDPKSINNLVQIDKYTVQLQHPTIADFASTIQANAQNAEQIVANCIVNVIDGDEVMSWSNKEKLEFVESMTTKQQKGISDFLKQMPIVSLISTYKCKACGKEHKSQRKGFQNFFL